MTLSSMRIELFVSDLEASIEFFTLGLGFSLSRKTPSYVSVTSRSAVVGLGLISNLPARDDGPGFSQERLHEDRGAGVEIVLETEDLEGAFARANAARLRIIADITSQAWGLRDFRVLHPDRYYFRITETV